jgi:hypothetical protein
MIKREHRLLWSARYEDERKAVMAECERVITIGGTFEIVNEYSNSWYSIITIYYPEESKHETGKKK